jgi:hypothetical protein
MATTKIQTHHHATYPQASTLYNSRHNRIPSDPLEESIYNLVLRPGIDDKPPALYKSKFAKIVRAEQADRRNAPGSSSSSPLSKSISVITSKRGNAGLVGIVAPAEGFIKNLNGVKEAVKIKAKFPKDIVSAKAAAAKAAALMVKEGVLRGPRKDHDDGDVEGKEANHPSVVPRTTMGLHVTTPGSKTASSRRSSIPTPKCKYH